VCCYCAITRAMTRLFPAIFVISGDGVKA